MWCDVLMVPGGFFREPLTHACNHRLSRLYIYHLDGHVFLLFIPEKSDLFMIEKRYGCLDDSISNVSYCYWTYLQGKVLFSYSGRICVNIQLWPIQDGSTKNKISSSTPSVMIVATSRGVGKGGRGPFKN